MIWALNTPITESIHACKLGKLRPARPHRRPRIRKKWLKRFGTKIEECTGVAYEIRFPKATIVCCPHYMKKLLDATKPQRAEET